MPPTLAVIVVLPIPVAVANPEEPIVETLASLDAQAT
jgi:hypothetical protein